MLSLRARSSPDPASFVSPSLAITLRPEDLQLLVGLKLAWPTGPWGTVRQAGSLWVGSAPVSLAPCTQSRRLRLLGIPLPSQCPTFLALPSSLQASLAVGFVFPHTLPNRGFFLV